MTDSASRRPLLRWIGWFALANALVFGLISLRYFGGFVSDQSALTWTYLVSVYVGHHVLITTVPLFLLTLPLVIIFPNKPILTWVSILFFSLMMALMVLDSLLWSQSRFHLNVLTMQILGWQSWVFAGFIFLIGLIFEFTLAKMVWNWLDKPKKRRGGLVASFCLSMIFLSQAIYAWADASYYVPVTSMSQQIPVYKGVTAKSLLTRLGLVDFKESRERQLARTISREMEAPEGRVLNYPLSPLQCENSAPYNLLIILADAMRGDMLTSATSPKMNRFAEQHGMSFRNHFSGGNSSRIGAFSLFYGLPPAYWSSFAALQRPSLFIDQLQTQGFEFGLFSSSTMYRPVMLDRTAFAKVPDLRVSTEPASDPSWIRDRKITDEWTSWLTQRDTSKPFFGFLFYDTTAIRHHPPDYPDIFVAEGEGHLEQEMVKYKNSVHYVDTLVGEVLGDLQERGLLEKTVVVISSDHGEEFGESGEDLKKHGSGYTGYQLKTPMVISWPGKDTGLSYDHRTSHYDLVPTLMQDLLGCTNSATDYSVGSNLFELREWDWLVAGSYFNFAVIESDQITVTFPTGLYEVRDWDYQLIEKPEFRSQILEGVSEQNSRYFVQ
jgi:membrane-anchored protein YejM (alkaline phosphatase superfamily)